MENNINEKKAIFSQATIGFKIIAFIVILALFATLFSLFGAVLSALAFQIDITPIESVTDRIMGNTDAIIMFQIISSIGLFILSVWLYVFFFENEPKKFLRLDKPPKLKMILFTMLVIFLANFALDLLVKLMYLIPFESSDNEIIKLMIQAEKDSEELLKSFLVFKSPIKFLVIFTMMAILPAVGEELTFRGVFYTLFKKGTNNNWLAILFSAFIFAIIHLQLHNLLAIFFMGALLAYIYYLTKNLWVSIFAHLFNNGLIVLMTYLNNLGFLTYDFSETEDFPLLVSIFGLLIFLVVFYFYKKYIDKETQLEYE